MISYFTPVSLSPADISKWLRDALKLYPKDFATVLVAVGTDDPEGKNLRVLGTFKADRTTVKLMNDELVSTGADFAGASVNNDDENILSGIMDFGGPDLSAIMYALTATQTHLIRVAPSLELIELRSGSGDTTDRTRIELTKEVIKLIRQVAGNNIAELDIDNTTNKGVITATVADNAAPAKGGVFSLTVPISFIDNSDGVTNTCRIELNLTAGILSLTRTNGTTVNVITLGNNDIIIQSTDGTNIGELEIEDNGSLTLTRNDGTDTNGIAINNTNDVFFSLNGAPMLSMKGDGQLAAVLDAYEDDTAAGVAGLTPGDLYQTDGTGAAPLNVAGIVMIKQ